MCGIFGFMLNRPLTPDDKLLGRRGTEMLRHRGPDGSGEWLDEDRGVYLGHRRLAIIDLTAASDQPMVDGRLILTYNGELYNFAEIRDSLAQLGHRFTSTGDTEVVLKAWSEWGEQALDRFDGMFALVIHDGEQLHLVTDPFGEKPLYWARTAEGIYFASEAQVLIELLGLTFAPSDGDIAAIMALGFIPAPGTGYTGFEVVPPATHLRLTASGPLSARCYWTAPRAEPHRGRLRPLSTTQIDCIQEALFNSLKRRVRADVPVGLFLSSGVDSSLIAAMVAKDLKLDLQTFTVSFPDGVDESAAASEIAGALGLRHEVVDSRDDNSGRDAMDALTSLYGVPNDNLTALSMHQMSALARRHMTVALSGVGGDELFYGYGKYSFLYKNRYVYRLPEKLISALLGLHPLMRRNRLWNTAARLLSGDRAWRYVSLKNSGLGELLDGLPGRVGWRRSDFTPEGRDLLYQVRDYDMAVTLPGSYIPAIDRGSMRAGLEVRTPFLSRDLVETIAAMDQRAFLAFGQKNVLRRIFSRYIPDKFIRPSKQGFVFPAERYLAAQSDRAPRIDRIPPRIAETIWKHGGDERYRGLAIRLSMLQAIDKIAAPPNDRVRAPLIAAGDQQYRHRRSRDSAGSRHIPTTPGG